MNLTKKSENNVQDVSGAVGRAFTVLHALAGRSISFGELERTCGGLAKSTLIRLIRSLVEAGLIEKKSDGLYTLGPESFLFARAALQLVSRGELVGPALRELADATRESAAYFEFDGMRIKLLNKVEKSNSFHYISIGEKVGRPHILVFARMILANSETSLARRILTHDTRVTSAMRARELKRYPKLCSAGIYAGSEEPSAGITRVVAPVFGSDDTAVGAIGVTLLGDRVGKKRLSECSAYVLEAAARAKIALRQE